jgi:pyrroline-5-carboxylate reductase
LKSSQVIAFDLDLNIRAAIKKSGVVLAEHPLEVVEKSEIVFLCVKPQNMKQAVLPLALQASPAALRKKCFVSIAAGITIARLESWLGDGVPVFRVMPNTPALLQAGMSAISRGRSGTLRQEKKIKEILSSVGETAGVPERWMDAVTAVSGSGPAYVFYLAEALIDGAKRVGLSAPVARLLAHQTIFGAGKMLAQRSEPADELRGQVTSPGGTIKRI